MDRTDCEHVWEQANVGLIASTVSIGDTCNHLRKFSIAKTDDMLEWPVWWADTRVLPSFLNFFSDAKVSQIFGPMHSWLVPNRTGLFDSWKGSGLSIVEGTTGHFQVDDMTFGQLDRAGEADSVTSAIFESQPGLLDDIRPSIVYQSVERSLLLLDRYGISSSIARQHFSSIAINLKEGFAERWR